MRTVDDRIKELAFNNGMTDGNEIQVKITLIRGFEMFGAYETWRAGYHIELFRKGELCWSAARATFEEAINAAEEYRDKTLKDN